MITCLACQVRWNALVIGYVCWSCGAEMERPAVRQGQAQYVFAGDAGRAAQARVHAGERG